MRKLTATAIAAALAAIATGGIYALIPGVLKVKVKVNFKVIVNANRFSPVQLLTTNC